MVYRRAGLVAALLALAGCSSDTPASSTRTHEEVRRAMFRSLPPGWRQFDELVQRRGPCHVIANSLAANFRADRAGSHGWAATMPPDGIAIGVSLIGPVIPGDERRADYPPADELPLELPRTTTSSLEGSPDVPEYRVFRRTPDYLVEVRADINNPEPGAALLDEAQSVVSRLRLPDWPELC
jgi:hypothetical protein